MLFEWRERSYSIAGGGFTGYTKVPLKGPGPVWYLK